MVAKLSVRKKPTISVIVVKIGPEARAGSIFIFFRIRGMVPPIDTAISVLIARALPTTRPKYRFAFQR
jgi:hypothetical protein